MWSSAEAHQKTINAELKTIETTAQSLLDQGTQEDVPTGMTPRKRVREYIDKWELTKNRDILLQYWRREPTTAMAIPASQTFTLPDVIEEAVEDMAEMKDHTSPVEYIPQAPSSPPAGFLTLSTTSTATLTMEQPPASPPIEEKKTLSMKSGPSTTIAWAERPTNILGPRVSRRIR